MRSVKGTIRFTALLGIGALLVAASPRPTSVRPGFNLFTPEQDVELGRESAAEVERQIPIVKDPSIERYVSGIGKRLAAVAPGPKFPYEFKVTNLSDVNAFALPGGFMYVNRGLIEFVPTEGQLAGVMAHEMSHVALRHQTNQVSKAYAARVGIGILGGLSGGHHSTGIMAALGGLGLNALFLKFSRTAEQQADIVGAQIMAKAGYDPREMADMFELLRRQAGRDPTRVERFLSDHPATADREARVRREASALGSPRRTAPVGDFGALKAAFRGLPPPVSMRAVAQARAPQPPERGSTAPVAVRIAPPSERFASFRQRNGFFRIEYPDNWRVYEPRSGFGVTIAPEGGVVASGQGQEALVCGVIVNHYDPFEATDGARRGGRRGPLEEATNDLVAQVRRSNPHLSPVAGSEKRGVVDGGQALTLLLAGTSPVTGQRESVKVFTRELSDGHVLYSLMVAPGADSPALSRAFDRMIGSLQVDDRAAHR